MATSSSSHPRRDRLAFARSDRWGLTVLLGLVALGTATAQLVAPLLDWAHGDPIAVPYVSAVNVPALDATGVAHGEGTYDVAVPDPGVAVRLADLAPGVLLTVLVAGGCWLVLRLMRDVAAGDPFRRANVTRLRILAVLVAVGLPTVWFTRAPVDLALLGTLDLGSGGPAVVVDVPWAPVVVGTVVALVAEAFRAGTRLRDDVEGLV